MDVFLWQNLDAGALATPRLSPSLLLRATFDGNTEKVAFFLNQFWTHLDWHGGEYPDEARVDVIVVSLEREMAEWVTSPR